MALVCVVYCDFATFSIGILGQVWYLIVSIPNLCYLSYLCDTRKIQIKKWFENKL